MAQNRHGQRQPLHVEHFAQPPTGKRGTVVAPVLRKSTQLLERRRAFGPEGPHAEPRVERLLRGRVAAEPVEALEQRAAAPAGNQSVGQVHVDGVEARRDNLIYAPRGTAASSPRAPWIYRSDTGGL